jgi:CheY-like chemotaxis protein
MCSSEKGDRDRIRLLLVDDEEGYVSVLSKRMFKRNIEVTAALSGSLGIQALRKQDFDVAVVDLKFKPRIIACKHIPDEPFRQSLSAFACQHSLQDVKFLSKSESNRFSNI